MDLNDSKQNRGIFISRPDPNLDDLIETARVISKAYKNQANFTLFEKISISYFSYKNQFEKLKNNNLKQQADFHGTRDFYNLIKLLTIKTRSSKFNDTEALYKQALNAIDRNFSGLRGDEREFKPLRRIFKEEYN